jgi:DME family drug/metabolite transporter
LAKSRPSSKLGYAAVALAGFLWAVGGTFARTVLDRGASAVELTEARAWITAVGIGSFLFLRRRSLSWEPLRRWPVVSAVVAFGLVLATANFTYYVAIAALPVAIAIVIQYTAPAIVVVWKALIGREPPSRRMLLALGLASIGVILISEAYKRLTGGSGNLSAVGVTVAVISAFGFAGALLLGEFLSETLGSASSVFGGFLVSSLFWATLQLFRGRPDTLLNPDFWPAILFLGVVTTIAPFSLFVWGLGKIGASAAGITSTLEPVGGAVLAYVWLGQSLSVVQILGGAAVVLGVALLQLEKDATGIPEVAGASTKET